MGFRSRETVPQRGARPSSVQSGQSLGPSSPHAQERIKMEQSFVGIDIGKERLDVHVRPGGHAFSAERTPEGLEELARRLLDLSPQLVGGPATLHAAIGCICPRLRYCQANTLSVQPEGTLSTQALMRSKYCQNCLSIHIHVCNDRPTITYCLAVYATQEHGAIKCFRLNYDIG